MPCYTTARLPRSKIRERNVKKGEQLLADA